MGIALATTQRLSYVAVLYAPMTVRRACCWMARNFHESASVQMSARLESALSMISLFRTIISVLRTDNSSFAAFANLVFPLVFQF